MFMARYIVADDEADSRDFLKRVISSAAHGAYVDEACDGRELVEKVKSGRYDLAFTDGNMPNMNGFDAIREIRRFNQELPICILSGDFNAGTIMAAEMVGATYCIEKGRRDTFDKILELVSKHSGNDGATRQSPT
jgi:CheY-like chemotaxis protein